MERVAFELSRHLSRLTKVKLVKWGGSNKWLPLVLPSLLFRSIWALATSNIQVIYLQDGLLAPLGVILKFFGKPVVITIHGKDITHSNFLYQFFIRRFVSRIDKVICVSGATADECIKRGIKREKITIIPNGISDELYVDGESPGLRARMAERLGIHPENRILLSVGRLVERKGFQWFVNNVAPGLMEECTDCVYLIAGDGVFAPEIRKAIERNNLVSKVFMLGSVGDEILRVLYKISDVFVMPNIPMKGDMEGFGVVALEAASCSLPLVAANLEGIKDAIQDGKNGFLIEPGNADTFREKIKELLDKDEFRESFGAQARNFTLENYGWQKVAERYSQEYVNQGNFT